MASRPASGLGEIEREREREGGRERASLGNFHNGGSSASPAHGLRITTLTGMLGARASRPATKHSSRLLNLNLVPACC